MGHQGAKGLLEMPSGIDFGYYIATNLSDKERNKDFSKKPLIGKMCIFLQYTYLVTW